MIIFSHTINLLTNMPKTCFEELLSPAVLEDENSNDEHNGKNMEAINIVLRFLDHRMTKAEVNEKQIINSNSMNVFKGSKNAKEALLPVLQLLILMCQSNRTIRKFCRQFILPPLGDEVLNLPTEGQKLRNK
jgi:predicted nucleotidyltransferase